MKVEILQQHLPGWRDAWYVKAEDKYYIISGLYDMHSEWEVLIFRADAGGNPLSIVEVGGGTGVSHYEAIQQIEEGYLCDSRDEE